MDSSPDKRPNVLLWLRNSFLTGVAVVLPFVVTVWLIWIVVAFIDTRVEPLIPQRLSFFRDFPGGGVLIAVAALTLVGALAGNLIGRWVVGGADRAIANLPLVRSIYGGAKQIFKQVAAPERTSFKQAVLVEFPSPGSYAIGFITNENTEEIVSEIGEALIAVYVPQAPIPTSGFLLYLPRTAMKPLAIGPDEALKRVISLGEIFDVELPVLLGVVQPGLQPLLLLFLGDVQHELEDRRTAVGQELFEVADVLVALAPDIFRHKVVYADDEHVFIVRTVEDADHALCRGGFVDAPEIVVSALDGAGGFEAGDRAALRVYAAEDVPDRAVLSAGVNGLQNDEQRALGFGVEHFLKIRQLLQIFRRSFFCIVAIVEVAFVIGVDLGELELLAGGDEIGRVDHFRPS
jgi:uncharacterized membrane protein